MKKIILGTLTVITVTTLAVLLSRPAKTEIINPLVNTPTPYPSPTATPTESQTEWSVGYASYYGERFRGRLTASGEVFNPDDLTCAHRTLPFDTVIKLWYDGRESVCRVNDRGPFVAGRVLDLSRATFMSLADLSQGVIRLKYKVVK